MNLWELLEKYGFKRLEIENSKKIKINKEYCSIDFSSSGKEVSITCQSNGKNYGAFVIQSKNYFIIMQSSGDIVTAVTHSPYTLRSWLAEFVLRNILMVGYADRNKIIAYVNNISVQ